MELRFVIASLRKWWWIVILGALDGALAAGTLAGPAQPRFQSTAVIAVKSPDGVATSPDRWVAQQIAILRSKAFSDRVAARASVDPDVAASAVKVAQQPATDLVEIVATDVNPQRAQRIAQATADE